MKFGKSLLRVVELSDPEWGPYWINYKFLKKKIREIIESQGGIKATAEKPVATKPSEIAKNTCEVEFFLQLKNELKKTSDFFASTEQLYAIRKNRVWEAFNMLKSNGIVYDKNTWSRLLNACVNFYKDVLLLENFAIMNYCGFSKILKKHDKLTGYATRDAFMRNVVNQQNFTHYPNVMKLINQSEKLFRDLQSMESVMPLQDEERLFIEAIRDLNYQASQLQSQERNAALASLENVEKNGNIPDVNNTSPSASGLGATAKTEPCDAAEDSVEDAQQAKKRKTSFNPYHGPSFITSIPDSNTPYISSMCIIDPSDRLDSATSLVIDAAMRLNHSNSAPLHSIVSWVNSPSKSKAPSGTVRNGGAPVTTAVAAAPARPPSANNSANNTPRVTGAKSIAPVAAAAPSPSAAAPLTTATKK